MLFDNLVKNGKSYNTAIGIIMEKLTVLLID